MVPEWIAGKKSGCFTLRFLCTTKTVFPKSSKVQEIRDNRSRARAANGATCLQVALPPLLFLLTKRPEGAPEKKRPRIKLGVPMYCGCLAGVHEGHGKKTIIARSSSREVRIWVPFFSVVYFSRGTLPPKKG